MKKHFKRVLCCTLSFMIAFASCFLGLTISFAEASVPVSAVFDFSKSEHISAMYAPGSIELENEAIKILIDYSYGYAKIRIPFELEKGKTYTVKYKIKAAQYAGGVTLLGAYAHKSNTGYDILKNSPTNDSKQVFNMLNLANLQQDVWNSVTYEFTADYADEYNYFGLFVQSYATGTYYLDDLEIAEKSEEQEKPEKTVSKFDFSKSEHISAMYAPGSIELENEAIKIIIDYSYGYAKIRIPFELEKGKTYTVKYKIKAAQYAGGVTLLGAYAHKSNTGYNILKNSPTNDSKQVFNMLNLANLQQDVWNNVTYEFTADYADEYNYFGLFVQSYATGTYYLDDLEIAEKSEEQEEPEEPEKPLDVKFDFSDTGHVSAMYAPGNIEFENESIKVLIDYSYGYAKIRFPVKLEKGKTYTVKYKVKSTKDLSAVTLLGAYALENGIGYDILKNSPTSDTKQVFNMKNLTNLQKDKWNNVKYDFTADYADGYNYFGLFIQSYVPGVYYLDDLEIAEKGDEPEKPEELDVKLDFSDEEQVSAMYAPDGVEVTDESIKVHIEQAYNYAKIRFPIELKKGETYNVRFKVKAAQATPYLSVLGAYACEENGYNILKNSPVNDTKQIFNSTNLNLKKDKWKTVTYTFTADYADWYNYFGLFIQSYVKGDYYIDDLEINNKKDSPFEPEQELSIKDYDFSTEEQLEYGSSAEIVNGQLKFTFSEDWGAGKTRFPFKFENGKAYELSLRIKSKSRTTLYIWAAYALELDTWDVIKNTDSKYVAQKINKVFTNSDWVELKFHFVANSPEDRYQHLGLFIQSSAVGEAYVDDMHIREIRMYDLKATFRGVDIDIDPLVAPASGDVTLPTKINNQFGLEAWYSDAALTKKIGFKLPADSDIKTLYAKIKYNGKYTIDFDKEDSELDISHSSSTTSKFEKQKGNTYISFNISHGYDNMCFGTQYMWFPNRSYRFSLRYKMSGTANIQLALLPVTESGDWGTNGISNLVLSPMRDTYTICDWTDLVVEFDTSNRTFDDEYKYFMVFVWFKKDTDAYMSLDDIVIEDLGVYKKVNYIPEIDSDTWDPFEEDASLYADWESWQLLNEKGKPVRSKEEKKITNKGINIVYPIAVGAAIVVAGVAVTFVIIKKKRRKS